MEFKNSKGIFQQIADNICEKILHKEYRSNEKLPSVREMAADIGVNPNTVMRTYTELQNNGIIKNRRGIGFFVEEGAFDEIIHLRRQEFIQHDLPEFFKKMELLNLRKDEIEAIINQLKALENEKK